MSSYHLESHFESPKEAAKGFVHTFSSKKVHDINSKDVSNHLWSLLVHVFESQAPVPELQGDYPVDLVIEEGSKDGCNDPDFDNNGNPSDMLPDGKLREAPTIHAALGAFTDLRTILQPPRQTGRGYKVNSKNEMDPYVRARLDILRTFLSFYVDYRSKTFGCWRESARQAALSVGRGDWCARNICRMARQFIADRSVLPLNPYGEWNESLLADEAIVNDVQLFLQSLGKEITAEKLAAYLAQDDVMAKHGIDKAPAIRTCRDYLHALGY
jgi:hypothetical protein